MTEIKGERWRKLDNAAKIFPAVSGGRDSRVFRFYCELTEEVDGDILQQALNLTLEKFPVYRSVMRKGLFWHYLEKSDIPAIVLPETQPPCTDLYIRDRKALLFKVNYYEKRINFEVYHALTDGTGAIAFLKEMVKQYLRISHAEENLPDTAFIDRDVTIQDLENDSFSKYYKKPEKNGKDDGKKRKVSRITGTKVGYGDYNIVEGILSGTELKNKAKELGVSVTVFLSAVLLCAIHEEMSRRQSHKEVVLMVPVNLRNYFPSDSMLNFFGWIEPGYRFPDGEYDFQDILQTVDLYFKAELNAEHLGSRMSKYMNLERQPIIRVVPLVIKNPVMQLANRFTERDVTALLSNLGVIRMPEEYERYITRFGVFINSSRLQLSLCSFKDDVVIGFNSAYQSKNIQRNFFRILQGFGIKAHIVQDQFPDHEEVVRKGRILLQWISFLCIALAVVSFVVNKTLTPNLNWFPLALAVAVSTWVVFAVGFYKRHNPLKNGIWEMAVFSIGCVLWDKFTGWHGWSLDFAFPILCMILMAASVMVSWIQKLKIQEYLIYHMMDGAISLLPLVFLGLGLVNNSFFSIICGGVSILFLAGQIIFKGKEMLAELQKKLHV